MFQPVICNQKFRMVYLVYFEEENILDDDYI